MKKQSLWSDTTVMPVFPKLKGDIKTDVLIIGGGIAGILCAYFLEKAGTDYVLVEGGRISSGITVNTTAKITIQHGLIYSEITKTMGEKYASLYAKANLDALETYETLCKDIRCNYEKKDSYIYSLSSRKIIEDEVKALKKAGIGASFERKTELPFRIKGAVKVPNQAQFNPLAFIKEISKNLNIYENTFINRISSKTASYDEGKIRANKIIVATHFPFINHHGAFFLKMYQHRSYVSLYENIPDIQGMYADEDINGLSFRCAGNYLLIGGGGHRTGKIGGAWHDAEKLMKDIYPDCSPKLRWAAQDCMTLDSVPYIGTYSPATPDMFVITGFNKWGFTSAMAGAKLLCDMVHEKENVYKKLFSPQRSILRPQLFVNGFESAKNLLTPSLRRCPHLGCALRWNKAEHTWDCPCHGSRFESDGTLIDNPATDDLK